MSVNVKTIKYVGYWSFGANSKKEAQAMIGIQVRQKSKPSLHKRLLAQLVSIYWIDKELSVWAM